MKSLNLNVLLLLCSTWCLASCALKIPNLRPVNPVPPALGIGAIYTETNSKRQGEMSVDEFVKFLYAQADDPATEENEEKGPASCFSSPDAEQIMVLIESACVKVRCRYEDYQEIAAVLKAVRVTKAKAMKLSLTVP